jgi:tetratricopeptide (TPR) repeat protein
MKVSVSLSLLLLLFSSPLAAQHESHDQPAPAQAVELSPGLGTLHHPVSTKNELAQKFFDQGLTYVYAFNHDEAIRSFQEAARLDPELAMARWGVALALGPNINLEVDPEGEKAAYEAEQKALSLAVNAPEGERAYIEALSHRYSIASGADLKKLAADYKNAMGEVVRSHPDDLDAATLYAESAMDLHPWHLWSSDGKPTEGTEEIVAVLESVLKRDPSHIGANHYYIHTMEASPHPERALASARRLETLVPAAGHLVHMPAHIYSRTGDFEASAEANERAAAADRAFIAKHGPKGIYPLMYYNHNLHFLMMASSMEGNLARTRKAAADLYDNVAPFAQQMPMIEPFLTMPAAMLVRFRKWDEVLKASDPGKQFPLEQTFRHFVRGMAWAATKDVKHAVEEERLFTEARKGVPADSLFGLNPSAGVFDVAAALLQGQIALARGESAAGLEALRNAVAAEDKLAYDEPADFFYPVRETLGGALLRSGAAAEAEKVFRADLDQNPRNGRSLFGLMKALEAQKKESDARFIESQFREAWSHADTQLTVDDL